MHCLFRVSGVGSCVELFESPEEVNIDRLNSLKTWTEKRLDTVIINMPGKDRDLYRLQCKTSAAFCCITNRLELHVYPNVALSLLQRCFDLLYA